MSGLARFSSSSDLDGLFGALKLLNPDQVKSLCAADFKLGLIVKDEPDEEKVLGWLTDGLESSQALESRQFITTVFLPLAEAGIARLGDCDVRIGFGKEAADAMRRAGLSYYVYAVGEGERLAGKLADEMGIAAIPVARRFPAFRGAVCRDIVEEVALQNTFWAVATAFPHIMPNPLEAWTATAELAGDTAVMTVNELRMAFLLAGACGHKVGLGRQWAEVAGIVGSGVGVSALAGTLVSLIPAGGGLLAKGALAFAASMAVGTSLSFWYQTGKYMKPGDLEKMVRDQMEEAKGAVQSVVDQVKGLGDIFKPKKVAEPQPQPDPAPEN